MGESPFFGFVYLIIEKSTGKYYCGRKQYFSKRGKKHNWKNYKSSSKPLLELIKSKNIDGFDFFCLMECRCKQDLYYYEVKTLMQIDGLLDPDCFNFHSPSVYIMPKGLPTRKRRESVNTLLKRNKTDGKAV